MRVCQCARRPRNRSAAGLRLCDVAFNQFGVDADDSADEAATAIVNVHLRNPVNVELLRDCSSPINDVDFAERDLGIACRHLLQARRELSAWAAPVCME